MKRVAILWFVAWSPLTSLAQSLPNLTVVPSGNRSVAVSWTVPTVSWGLQETTNLAIPAAWHASSLVPVSNACTCSVTVPVTNATRFFRLLATTAPAVGIYIGTPTQRFYNAQPSAMGMHSVPDQHIAVMQQSNGSYKLWIAGVLDNGANKGSTALLLTTNFLTYTSGYASPTNADPVLVPSGRGLTASNDCANQIDAGYAGADLVFTATNGHDLLMLYDAETKNFGAGPPNSLYPSWGVMGLVRSPDQGITWTGAVAVVSSSDPKPATNPPPSVYGIIEPGAIIASNYIYAYYAYFPTPDSTNGGPMIQVARAPLSSDGAPGSWMKYYNGSFSQPALLATNSTAQSLGSAIIPTVCGCTRTAQPWPVYSTYLDAYVLVFLAHEGWFFSTSTNLVNWTSPTQFFTAPVTEFTTGQPTDENVILVTPGNPNQVIGQTGLVVYAHTAAWSTVPHQLWTCPFTFTKSP